MLSRVQQPGQAAHFLEGYERKRLIEGFLVYLCGGKRTRTGKLFMPDMQVSQVLVSRETGQVQS